MPLGFGTTTNLPRQVYRFAEEKKPAEHKRASLVSFLRIFIVIAEVGLSLVPGLQETTALVGIGLAGASANTALSAHEGTLSGIGVGFDFGAALIPAFNGLRIARKIGKATASDLARASEEIVLRETEKTTTTNFFADADKELRKSLGKSARKSSKATREWDKSIKMAEDLAKKMTNGEMSNAEMAAIEIAAQAEVGEGLAREAREIERRALERYSTTQERVDAVLQEWKDIFEKIRNLPRAKRVSRSKFIGELEKLGGKERLSLLKQIYVPAIKGKANMALELERTASLTKIAGISEKLSDDVKLAFDAFTRKAYASGFNMTKTEMNRIVKDFMEAIKEIDPSQYHLIKQYSDSTIENAFSTFTKDAEPSAIKRWVKKLGSRNFNDKVVQNLQLIDPNDMGRAPVERAYQYLKEKIEKKLTKKAMKRAMGATTKGIKASAKIEEAFVKSGGTLFPPNRYILGMKVLGGVPNKRIALIRFNKLNTSSKTGNNVGGKKDILITANDLDLERLEMEGKSYWFSVGRKRGWFVSRGGKRAKTGFAVLSNEMSLFLGFVPIPALRNVLSIVSNWVENIADMSRGTYLKEWKAKFERAFLRSAVNRSARLTSRVIIGGLAIRKLTASAISKAETKAANAAIKQGLNQTSEEFGEMVHAAVSKVGRKGMWIGRELQRLSTTTLSTFEGKTKEGYFTFTDGSSRTRSTGENIARKLFFTAAPTSVRGALTRHGTRSVRGTGRRFTGRQLVGNNRYMRQMGRIWSAAVPAGTVKPLRSLTRIR